VTSQLLTLLADIRPVAYEGEGDAGGSATGAPPAATGAPPAATGTPPADGTPPASGFSQEDVNRMLADDRRKHQEQTKKALAEAEALKSKARLTQEERNELDKRLQILQDELLTKEELAKKEQDRLRKTHESQVSELTNSRDVWKDRFTDAAIRRSITDAAAKHEAFSVTQIVALLQPNTRLVEELDAEGKITGNLAPKVRFDDTDKDGKPVTLELTPVEAVKRMREMDEHLNLFRGKGVGGLGENNQSNKTKMDLKELAKDPEAYRKARAEGRIKF